MTQGPGGFDHDPHEHDPHEVLKASGPGANQIDVGLEVIGFDGERVGKVKEVRPNDFLLDRPMAHDLYVPYTFIMSVPDRGDGRPNEVVLNVTSENIDHQGWRRP